ncbi:MAG: glycoside hydrolase family 3 protein [candidate division Zixibacteria bacterium]|nr:glycoside hydrolase family 3 protein [candidate division Zixibacteria bacterium]
MNPGQRIILGIEGTYLTDSVISILSKKQIGGIILFDHNGENPNQLKALINSIYNACEIKPFIAIDFEGGRIRRLKKFFHLLAKPSEYDGKANELKSDCENVGRDFKEYNINLNLAPVADISYSPLNAALEDRTFSADPLKTSEYCISFCEGFAKNNILCCLKHFPGLGSSTNDPHKLTAVSCLPYDRIRENDLVPFKAGINAGVNMLMTTHLLMTAIDDKIGAFSVKTTGLARALGFEGIIISDDLCMGALKSEDSLPEITLKSLCAGHDMALICHNHSRYNEIISYLENNISVLEKHGHKRALERIRDAKESLS